MGSGLLRGLGFRAVELYRVWLMGLTRGLSSRITWVKRWRYNPETCKPSPGSFADTLGPSSIRVVVNIVVPFWVP